MVDQRHTLLVLSAAAVFMLGGCQWTWRARTPVEARRPIDLAEAGPTVAQRATLDAAAAARAGGDYEQALRLFREILAENPMATSAYVGIGDIQLEQQNYEDAERQFGQAARLEPRNFAAQFGHGRALQMLERFVEAVKAYHRALTIRPEDFDANHQLAATYLRMGKATNAVVFAEKAVEVRPDDGAARVDLGAAYASVGRNADAIVQYQAAMERIEPTPEVLMGLVNALAAEQRYHEAVNTTEFLVRLAPTADAYERLGWGAFRIGDYARSMTAYQSAVEQDPNHWQSWNGIGVNALNTWLLSGRVDQDARTIAKQAFRNSIRINAEQPKVIRLLSQYHL